MKNLRTTNWPNKTTARTMTTFLMGPFPKSRAATCQERQRGHGRRWLVRAGGSRGPGWGGSSSRDGVTNAQALTQPPLCAIHLAMQRRSMKSATKRVTWPRKPVRPRW